MEMERLTHERKNGIKTGYWSPNKKDELVARLAEYENTGLEPAEIVKLQLDEKKKFQKRKSDPACNSPYRVTPEQLEMFLEFYRDADEFQDFLIYNMAAELKELREKTGQNGGNCI